MCLGALIAFARGFAVADGVVVLALPRVRAFPPGGILAAGGEDIVRITFTRSGGLVAAPGLTIEGSVSVDTTGAHVSADGGQYTHRVSAGDLVDLVKRLDIGRLFTLKKDLRSPSRGAADQYQYDITLETSDGKRHSLTVGGQQSAGELDSMAPGLGALVDWVRHEADAIWQARVERR
jgi:hypothetical protein